METQRTTENVDGSIDARVLLFRWALASHSSHRLALRLLLPEGMAASPEENRRFRKLQRPCPDTTENVVKQSSNLSFALNENSLKQWGIRHKLYGVFIPYPIRPSNNLLYLWLRAIRERECAYFNRRQKFLRLHGTNHMSACINVFTVHSKAVVYAQPRPLRNAPKCYIGFVWG